MRRNPKQTTKHCDDHRFMSTFSSLAYTGREWRFAQRALSEVRRYNNRMESWREYINAENPTDDQLKSIPLLSCEQISPLLTYSEKNHPEMFREIEETIGADMACLKDPHNWISALQFRQLSEKFAAHRRKEQTHQGSYEISKANVLKKGSALGLFVKLAPLYVIFASTQRDARKWNNAAEAEIVALRKGHAMILLNYRFVVREKMKIYGWNSHIEL